MKSASRLAILCALCSFLSLGMGSCSPTPEEACRSRLPELQQDFADAARAIGQELASRGAGDIGSGGGRSIASVGPSDGEKETPRRYFSLDPSERDQWQDWSASRLKLVERYLDFVRTRTEMAPARQPLADIAEKLVDFNGYADRGELYQMRETLQQARQDADDAARLGCAAVSR